MLGTKNRLLISSVSRIFGADTISFPLHVKDIRFPPPAPPSNAPSSHANGLHSLLVRTIDMARSTDKIVISSLYFDISGPLSASLSSVLRRFSERATNEGGGLSIHLDHSRSHRSSDSVLHSPLKDHVHTTSPYQVEKYKPSTLTEVGLGVHHGPKIFISGDDVAWIMGGNFGEDYLRCHSSGGRRDLCIGLGGGSVGRFYRDLFDNFFSMENREKGGSWGDVVERVLSMESGRCESRSIYGKNENVDFKGDNIRGKDVDVDVDFDSDAQVVVGHYIPTFSLPKYDLRSSSSSHFLGLHDESRILTRLINHIVSTANDKNSSAANNSATAVGNLRPFVFVASGYLNPPPYFLSLLQSVVSAGGSVKLVTGGRYTHAMSTLGRTSQGGAKKLITPLYLQIANRLSRALPPGSVMLYKEGKGATGETFHTKGLWCGVMDEFGKKILLGVAFGSSNYNARAGNLDREGGGVILFESDGDRGKVVFNGGVGDCMMSEWDTIESMSDIYVEEGKGVGKLWREGAMKVLGRGL